MNRFSIQIKNPCEENRDNMLPTEMGKFCMACQKEVIDFTTLSDAEIILFFKNNKNKCGTFKASQLDRNLFRVNQPNTHRPTKYFFASLLSLNFLSASASINPKLKIENDSMAIVFDSTIVKKDSTELIKADSIAVTKLFLNDSIIKSITISPFNIIGGDIVTSGVPMIQTGGFIFDSSSLNQFIYTITPAFVMDTIKKIKKPFASSDKEKKEKQISPTNSKKKEKPIKSVLPFQAILTKRIFFNQTTKWFDWW